MEASCLAVSNRVRNSLTSDGDVSNYAKRKSDIVARQRDSVSQILKSELFCENHVYNARRQELLVNYFLKRTKSLLSVEDFSRFLELLTKFLPYSEKESLDRKANLLDSSQVEDVYKNMKGFLKSMLKDYTEKGNLSNKKSVLDGIQELIDISILFLDFPQANACGESYNYL